MIFIYATNRYLLAVMAKFYVSCYLVTVLCFWMIMQYIPLFGKFASASSSEQTQRHSRGFKTKSKIKIKTKIKILCDAFTRKKVPSKGHQMFKRDNSMAVAIFIIIIISIKYRPLPVLDFHFIIFVRYFLIKFSTACAQINACYFSGEFSLDVITSSDQGSGIYSVASLDLNSGWLALQNTIYLIATISHIFWRVHVSLLMASDHGLGPFWS